VAGIKGAILGLPLKRCEDRIPVIEGRNLDVISKANSEVVVRLLSPAEFLLVCLRFEAVVLAHGGQRLLGCWDAV
jgi:hypothetical protein